MIVCENIFMKVLLTFDLSKLVNGLEMKGSVSGKIKCIFEPKVIQSTSGKRKNQLFKVVASETPDADFLLCSQSGNIFKS